MFTEVLFWIDNMRRDYWKEYSKPFGTGYEAVKDVVPFKLITFKLNNWSLFNIVITGRDFWMSSLLATVYALHITWHNDYELQYSPVCYSIGIYSSRLLCFLTGPQLGGKFPAQVGNHELKSMHKQQEYKEHTT